MSEATRNHRTPDYRVVVDGRDITPTVDARLVSLQVQQSRGGEADQLDLTLSDHDGALAIPRRGVRIDVALGWTGEALVDMGSFNVDEAEHSGAPDTLTIRARSADLGHALRERREQSWHATTVGAIVREIALRSSLQARVDETLAARAVAHVDQTHESDSNFLTRLARLHDAVATVKKGRLLFLPIARGCNAAGDALPTFTLTRADGDSHRYAQADRDAYTGVRAYWHDGRGAKRRSVLAGTAVNAKGMKETFATEADARVAATAEWGRVQRGLATMSLTLAMGVPGLGPQCGVRVDGFKPDIDVRAWLVASARHVLESDGGFTSSIELEGHTGTFT